MAYVKKRKGSRGFHWDACWDVYIGGKRKERSKTFNTQKDAKHYLTTIGVHKPNSGDPFKMLAEAFLDDYEAAVKAKHREETTVRQLRQHINLHILPDTDFSALRCGDIGTPEVQCFLDRLYARGAVSPSMTSKVRTTLSQVFSFGARRGYCSANPARESKVTLSASPEAGEEGEDFILPPKDDLRRLHNAACRFDNNGQAEAVLRTLMYGGLRASEMRGLPRRGLSLDGPKPKLRIDQKADKYDKIGRVKAKMSRRDVPLGPDTVKAIQRWLDAATESEFVFPNGDGNIWSYSNLWNRFWVPLMNKAGLVTDKPASKTTRGQTKGAEGYKQPRFGLHMLRHVYASLQIEQGVQPKRLQALMGHSTLKVTMDTYGHLWPDDEGDQLAASVEQALG
jgi:integrase